MGTIAPQWQKSVKALSGANLEKTCTPPVLPDRNNKNHNNYLILFYFYFFANICEWLHPFKKYFDVIMYYCTFSSTEVQQLVFVLSFVVILFNIRVVFEEILCLKWDTTRDYCQLRLCDMTKITYHSITHFNKRFKLNIQIL